MQDGGLWPCWSGGTPVSERQEEGFEKIHLGRGNWCVIKGKRLLRKMEAWSFEKYKKY